jgi:hypothetical protein
MSRLRWTFRSNTAAGSPSASSHGGLTSADKDGFARVDAAGPNDVEQDGVLGAGDTDETFFGLENVSVAPVTGTNIPGRSH